MSYYACPCCTSGLYIDTHSRRRLESLRRRRGRRAHKLRVAVERLDDRYREATAPSPDAYASEDWWDRREVRDR
ncbi:MAG: hypothetical protein QM809_14645 [Gordonia sp. (in: high G+C Gram-positive bacteria)]|uniref:hypothetical protein n=1 Tax=Gordonia sp. (in: high G+C Gram-positive bacteria) TaxID=84139 RepID=UPI0039E35B4E